MEMVIANRFGKQDHVLIPTNGKFGERVAEMAMRYCDVTHIRYEWGQSFDIEQLEQLSKNNNFESLIICHNETSAGITQDAEALSMLAFIWNGIHTRWNNKRWRNRCLPRGMECRSGSGRCTKVYSWAKWNCSHCN